jgi:hypothetical protein
VTTTKHGKLPRRLPTQKGRSNPANGTNDRPIRAACQLIASCVPATCQRPQPPPRRQRSPEAMRRASGGSARAAQSSLRRRLRLREVGALSRLRVEQVVLSEPRQQLRAHRGSGRECVDGLVHQLLGMVGQRADC